MVKLSVLLGDLSYEVISTMDTLKVCRLCLCKSDFLMDIFEMDSQLGFNVGETIADLLHIQVTKVKGIPSLICSTCINELDHFRIFKSRCVDSKVSFDEKLRSRLATDGELHASQENADQRRNNEGAVGEGSAGIGTTAQRPSAMQRQAGSANGGERRASVPDGFEACGGRSRCYSKASVHGDVAALYGAVKVEDTIGVGHFLDFKDYDDLPLMRKYTVTELACALEEVMSGRPIRVVGRAYGIPESTIRSRLAKNKRWPRGRRRNSAPKGSSAHHHHGEDCSKFGLG